jgi:Na+-driven multidrug efflux pump
MMPLVLGCVIACVVVLPLALHYCIAWLGFVGSALAVVAYQVAQLSIVWLYLKIVQPHHPQSWTGLHNWRQALAWVPLKTYLHLGAGGIIASSECTYAIAGS